jgi:hypothetical protein
MKLCLVSVLLDIFFFLLYCLNWGKVFRGTGIHSEFSNGPLPCNSEVKYKHTLSLFKEEFG